MNTAHFRFCRALASLSGPVGWVKAVALLSVAWRLAEERTELWGPLSVDGLKGESHAYENYFNEIFWYPVDLFKSD